MMTLVLDLSQVTKAVYYEAHTLIQGESEAVSERKIQRICEITHKANRISFFQATA